MENTAVYRIDGSAAPYRVKGVELHDEWMGEKYVIVDLSSAIPIAVEIGDHFTYRGETFSIYNVPSALKQARRNTYGEAFKYEGVKFSFCGSELSEAMFFDYVLEDNQIHYVGLPTFSVYCATVDDLLDRLQANMNNYRRGWVFLSPSMERSLRRGATSSQWEVIYGEGSSTENEKLNVDISVDASTVWDGLSMVHEKFGLDFWIRERVVAVGAVAKELPHEFMYGKGNGLSTIQRMSDSEQQVVTRLFAYGGEQNLPAHYYSEDSSVAFCTIMASHNWSDRFVDLEIDLPCKLSMFSDLIEEVKEESYSSKTYRVGGVISDKRCIIRVQWVSETFEEYSTAEKKWVKRTAESWRHHVYDEDNTSEVMEYLRGATLSGERLIFVYGVKKEEFPGEYRYYEDQDLPNTMAINFLMLPGFPKYALSDLCRSEYDEDSDETVFYIRKTPDSEESEFMRVGGNRVVTFSADKYRPYLLSPNVMQLGIKDGLVRMTEENDDNGLKDVHPSIEEMTVGDVFGTDSAERLDEVVGASVINDGGIFVKEQEIPNFHIQIKDLGFDLEEAYSNHGGDMTLSVTDGYCGGVDFPVVKVRALSPSGWDLECKRTHDDTIDVWFPNSYGASIGEQPKQDEASQIRPGDHFVLTNIDITDTAYIWAASVKLLRKAIKWLLENDHTRFTYVPKINEIFMRKERDEVRGEGELSLHDQISSGMLLHFHDDDLFIDGRIYIDTLTIKEDGNNGIPTYDVTLREKKSVSARQRSQNKVDSLAEIVSKTGYSPEQIRQFIESYGRDYFLSKKVSDRAQGKIVFEQGAEFGGYTRGSSGGAFFKDADGNWHLESDYVRVRKSLQAESVEIQEARHIGGMQLQTAAAMRCSIVVEHDTFYRCGFLKVDGDGKTIYNNFQAGDLAYCKTFNIESKNSYSNKYYWRLIVGTSNDEGAHDDIENEYHWIDISKSDCAEGSDMPAEGDDIIQLGNKEGAEGRTTAIIQSAAGDGSPYISLYKGIVSYTLPEPEVHLGAQESTFKGRVTITGGTGASNIDDLPDAIGDVVQVGGENLLLNTGFTGDYESRELDEHTELNSDLEMYSPGMLYWNGDGESVEIEDSISGRGVRLSGDIWQAVELLQNEVYTISLYAGGGTLRISCGGFSETAEASGERHTFRFTSDRSSNVFLLSGEGVTVWGLKLERGTIATDWCPSRNDKNALNDKFRALNYLQQAIRDGGTDILGGLVLTSLINLGPWEDGRLEKVTAGVSGIYNDDDDVAFWGGGNFEQAIRTVMAYKKDPLYLPSPAELSNMAKVVLTHGGRAILNDVVLRGYIYAEGGKFRGDIEFENGLYRGFLKNVPFHVNGLNFFDAFDYENDMRLRLDKTGSHIVFDSYYEDVDPREAPEDWNWENAHVYFPSLKGTPSATGDDISEPLRDDFMGYVGAKVIIEENHHRSSLPLKGRFWNGSEIKTRLDLYNTQGSEDLCFLWEFECVLEYREEVYYGTYWRYKRTQISKHNQKARQL